MDLSLRETAALLGRSVRQVRYASMRQLDGIGRQLGGWIKRLDSVS